LPLVIDHCKLPSFLKGKLYADFRTPESYDTGLQMVLKRLSSPLARRVNPAKVSLQTKTDAGAKLARDLDKNFAYREAADALKIYPQDLGALPTNARFSLFYRCSRRSSELLLANWHDGRYVWDTLGPLNDQVHMFALHLMVSPRARDRKEGLKEAMEVVSDGLSIVNRYPQRVECPQVVSRVLGVYLATFEFCFGSDEAGYKAFYETYEIYKYINQNNAITCRDMREDYLQIKAASRKGHWKDSDPLDFENGYDDMWRMGEPAYFRSDLQQKVSFWRTIFDG
jgi:hypothetical protein